MKNVRWCAIPLALLGLAGCMSFNKSEPLRIIAPDYAVTAEPGWPHTNWSLIIQRPVTDQTRGGVRVVVRAAHSRLAYYPGVAWLDDLPAMLQADLLRAFVDSGRIAAVARPGGARARFALATEIRRFDAVEESPGRLNVELELQITLLEVRSGDVEASAVFSHRAPVTGAGADGLAAAFEVALSESITEVIGWTLAAAPDSGAEE